MRARLILFAFLLLPALGRGEIIDRIAAVVEEQVITLSEVNQLIELRLIQQREGEDEAAYRRRVLEAMIVQSLRYRDVERFGAQEVSKDAIEAELRRIILRFPSEEAFEEALARTELTRDDVRSRLQRRLQVDAYIEERLAPMIFVSIQEIEDYYAKLWVPQRRERGLSVQSLSDVREEILRLVRAERLQAEVQRWSEQLRARANVDVFVYR